MDPGDFTAPTERAADTQSSADSPRLLGDLTHMPSLGMLCILQHVCGHTQMLQLKDHSVSSFVLPEELSSPLQWLKSY